MLGRVGTPAIRFHILKLLLMLVTHTPHVQPYQQQLHAMVLYNDYLCRYILVPVLLYAIMNHRFKFMVPSSDNYFSGYKIDKVMVDSGSASHLLPILSPDNTPAAAFAELLRVFPTRTTAGAAHNQPTYSWDIEVSSGVGSKFLKLIISRHDDVHGVRHATTQRLQCQMMRVDSRICTEPFYLEELHFYLYKSDVQYLHDHHELLTQDGVRALVSYDINKASEQRRTHALIGQDLLKEAASMQCKRDFVVIFSDDFMQSHSNLTNAWQQCRNFNIGLSDDLIDEECDEADMSMMSGYSEEEGVINV